MCPFYISWLFSAWRAFTAVKVKSTSYVYWPSAEIYIGLEQADRWTHLHCRPHSCLPSQCFPAGGHSQQSDKRERCAVQMEHLLTAGSISVVSSHQFFPLTLSPEDHKACKQWKRGGGEQMNLARTVPAELRSKVLIKVVEKCFSVHHCFLVQGPIRRHSLLKTTYIHLAWNSKKTQFISKQPYFLLPSINHTSDLSILCAFQAFHTPYKND